MDDPTDGQNLDDVAGDMLAALSDKFLDSVTGVPAPIRKNAARAFTRLCTAAVEYPAALIENAIAEKRAETQARIKLINTSAEQIAGQMQTSEEYARAAARKFGQKIIRERVNVDLIAQSAVEELQRSHSTESGDQEPEAEPISEDWLNAFENEAAQMSSEQMQRLFAKILAGEIRKPSSYSIRTIKIVAQLDNTAAALFNILCSLCVSIEIPSSKTVLDARVISMGDAGRNSLSPYGLSFDQLNILEEYGLVISDYNSSRDFAPLIARDGKVSLVLNYLGDPWAFVPKGNAPERSEFKLGGVALTRSARELLPIVDKRPNDPYTVALKGFLDQQGMVMTRVNI